MLRTIKMLKNEGSCVVVMDKEEYLRLLAEASTNDATKFRLVETDKQRKTTQALSSASPERKELESIVRRILPTPVADSVRPSGTRLAHLYGLPKTHEKVLAMRPILSATQTYNYALAKWLHVKLKPLSTNQYTITDAFDFKNEIQQLSINNGDILVSYDVSFPVYRGAFGGNQTATQ